MDSWMDVQLSLTTSRVDICEVQYNRYLQMLQSYDLIPLSKYELGAAFRRKSSRKTEQWVTDR